MSAPLTYIKETYNDFYDKHSDPRTRELPLMSSPVPTLVIITLYVLFVKVVGPRMMRDRKPFELKNAMIFYNGLQAFLSFALFTMGWFYGWRRYSFSCQPIGDNHPNEKVMITLGYLFFLIRFLEFTDTIFFVLRKKFNQVSTLHVVHHTLVPLLFWVGVLCVPAGHYSLPGFLNAIVHFFMYSYYLLAALGPKYQHLLVWKKHMTTMQLVQFVIVLVHTVQTLVTDCNVPKWFAWIMLFQAVLFFSMFLQFYIQTFSKPKGVKASNAQKIQNGSDANSQNHSFAKASTSGLTNRKLRVHSD